MLTQAELQRILRYDPLTGLFTNRIIRGRAGQIGAPAGYIATSRYGHQRVIIRIHRKNYKAHRLAWLYITGEWPPGQIDHRNRGGTDNRFSNFRLATTSQNNANSKTNRRNKSGSRGVSWSHKVKKWWAQITCKKRHYNLGYFDSKADAATVYRQKARELFGEFACPD